jgi:hypothetical protein
VRQPVLKLYSTITERYGQAVIDHRALLVLAVQFLLIVLANLTAFLLRFDGEIPAPYDRIMLSACPSWLRYLGQGCGHSAFNGGYGAMSGSMTSVASSGPVSPVPSCYLD